MGVAGKIAKLEARIAEIELELQAADVEPLPRVVCWFSCGVTSAVAAKMAYDRYHNEREVVIAYCQTNSEHPDNERFLHDCENWIGAPIVQLTSKKYKDVWDVWEKTGWLKGPKGVRCTVELKKAQRFAFQRPDDLHVFGFDSGEARRVERFRENNFELDLYLPLVDGELSKSDCANQILRAGIEIPMMYRLGYSNSNCIGCPNGQQSYWNKIRVDFPDVFARMSKLERKLNVALNKKYDTKVRNSAGKVIRQRVFLDELDPKAGNAAKEPDFKCGLSCGPQDNAEVF